MSVIGGVAIVGSLGSGGGGGGSGTVTSVSGSNGITGTVTTSGSLSGAALLLKDGSNANATFAISTGSIQLTDPSGASISMLGNEDVLISGPYGSLTFTNSSDGVRLFGSNQVLLGSDNSVVLSSFDVQIGGTSTISLNSGDNLSINATNQVYVSGESYAGAFGSNWNVLVDNGDVTLYAQNGTAYLGEESTGNHVSVNGSAISIVDSQDGSSVTVSSDITVSANNALQLNGNTIGMFGATPVSRAAAISTISNSATGTQIATAVNALITAIQNIGITL